MSTTIVYHCFFMVLRKSSLCESEIVVMHVDLVDHLYIETLLNGLYDWGNGENVKTLKAGSSIH